MGEFDKNQGNQNQFWEGGKQASDSDQGGKE